MSLPPFRKEDAFSSDEEDVLILYWQMLVGWNKRSIEEFAIPFAEDAEFIGLDGSQMIGREEIISTLRQIFDNQVTTPYVSKIKRVRLLSRDVAMLHAITGMLLPDQSDFNPALNAHQTLVAVKHHGAWRITFCQNTSTHFHGQPELIQHMTEELRQEFRQLREQASRS
jgi:uncharacterized protein (TIGR02246 family)